MLTTINKSWNWIGVKATEIIKVNDFGNIIFKSNKNDFWRICPEELSCEKIADNEHEFISLFKDSNFLEDWKMTNLVNMASKAVGKLENSEKYCLKLPGSIGGAYETKNIGKISQIELIEFSGNLAKQLIELPDGTKIKLTSK